ncbi:hypothetical protein [Brevundimonas sp. FT23028]|uniref:hypothetical protein n=1 Tax=Brevundimonas sp. FT23028 TaxID=3393748 RepID=UPI003B588F2B
MSVTYTEDRAEVREDAFVPVYARKRSSGRSKGGVKTWMILAPVGVLLVGGAAAAMMMGGGEDTAPLVEPAATAPVVPAASTPLTAPAADAMTPVEAAPSIEPAATPAPVRREAAPVRRSPTARPQIPAEPAARVTVAPSSPETSALNAAPVRTGPEESVTTTPTTPPPSIVVQPLD